MKLSSRGYGELQFLVPQSEAGNFFLLIISQHANHGMSFILIMLSECKITSLKG